jgi:PEP-CTERM motif
MLKLILKRSVVTLPVVAVSLVALLGEGNSAKAQVISYEGFNYTNGTSIAGQSGGDSTGWGNTWANSTAGSKIATNTVAGLTYGDLRTDAGALQVGTPQSASGPGSAGGTTAAAQRLLPDTLGNLAAANGGILWLSFLFYNPTYPTTTYYRQSNLGFFSGATGQNANGSEKADLGLDNGSATVGTDFSAWGGTVSAAAPNQSTVSAFSDNVQFVLVELVVDNTTANDTYYAWFNTDPSTFGNNLNTPDISTANLTNSGADLSSVNALRFQAGNNNANGTNAFFTVDEIDLGDSFADVTPTPEPATISLAAAGGALLLALRRKRKQ